MLLGIDTCGTTGTIALGRTAGEKVQIVGQAELPAKRNSSDLIPELRALLARHDVSLLEIEVFVVVSGPGSFTGVRIGLSTIKGLAEALVKSVVAVSRLSVLAHKAQADTAALDAGRGELYFGTYPGRNYHEKYFETLLMPGQITEPEEIPVFAVCEPAVQSLFPGSRMVAPPTAADALDFALPRILSGDFDDPPLLDANYLRRSDAEVHAAAAAGTEGPHS